MIFLNCIALALLASSGSNAFSVTPLAQSQKSTTAVNLLGRFRKRKAVGLKPIPIGSPVPDVDVEMLTTTDTDEVTTVPVSSGELLGKENSKSILVGMPGAFTPVCTSKHLPGLIEASSKLHQLGVDKVAVVTTNDKFVNEEWARKVGLITDGGKKKSEAITILADGDAELVKSLGMVDDMGFGMGVRSKRFALVCEDGKVTEVLTDEGMDVCDVTSAESMIDRLTPQGPIGKIGIDADQQKLLGGAGVFAIFGFMLVAASLQS